ncbi:MAG TPA: hypothetical protein VEO56_14780 [Bacteroidota bacterium]|nr:hypothetical protein [Bacteroidota bacterium]
MKNTKGFPWYVKAGLWGIRTRKAALVQFWTSVIISVVILFAIPPISHSFFWTIFFCGTVLMTAKWYWSAIRWVDNNARWENAPSQSEEGTGAKTGETESRAS